MVCTTRAYRLATSVGLCARCLSRRPSFGRIRPRERRYSLLQLLTSLWSTKFLIPDAKLLYSPRIPPATSQLLAGPVPACGQVGHNPRRFPCANNCWHCCQCWDWQVGRLQPKRKRPKEKKTTKPKPKAP